MRTPTPGVKAQWVRIELRKVETLPGGGDSNTFYDYVGPSPVTLWSAPDEYNLLKAVSYFPRQAIHTRAHTSTARLSIFNTNTRVDTAQYRP